MARRSSTRIFQITNSWAGMRGTLVADSSSALVRSWDDELRVGRAHHGLEASAVPQFVKVIFYKDFSTDVARFPEITTIRDAAHWAKLQRGLIKTCKGDKVSCVEVQYNQNVTLRVEMLFVHR